MGIQVKIVNTWIFFFFIIFFLYIFLAMTGEMKMKNVGKLLTEPVNKCQHNETINLKENVFILTIKTFISEKMMSGQKYE